jgi:hypothetical protein
VNGTNVALDWKFKAEITKIQAKDTVEKGMFIKGMIESANIHNTNRSFSLYPFRGPEKIRCVFPAHCRAKVMESFGKFVRVHGDFKYEWRDKQPYEIAVKEIETLPDPSEIDIRKIWGAAPKATGKLSTEKFIKNLRYG